MTNDLKNVKAGDEVILIARGLCGGSSKTIEKVVKITPKGFIKVGSFLYYTNGHERGGSAWSGSRIKLATKEEIEAIKKENYCRRALSYLHDLKKIDYNKAVKIMEILKGAGR